MLLIVDVKAIIAYPSFHQIDARTGGFIASGKNIFLERTRACGASPSELSVFLKHISDLTDRNKRLGIDLLHDVPCLGHLKTVHHKIYYGLISI